MNTDKRTQVMTLVNNTFYGMYGNAANLKVYKNNKDVVLKFEAAGYEDKIVRLDYDQVKNKKSLDLTINLIKKKIEKQAVPSSIGEDLMIPFKSPEDAFKKSEKPLEKKNKNVGNKVKRIYEK
jgi:hypothetical protein